MYVSDGICMFADVCERVCAGSSVKAKSQNMVVTLAF